MIYNPIVIYKGWPLDIQGRGGRKIYEINKFLLKNSEKFTCTQAPYTYSIIDYVKKIYFSAA